MRKVFSPNSIAHTDTYKIKMKFYPDFIPYIKMKARWTINLNVKSKEIRFLDYIKEYLHNLGQGKNS